MTMSPKTVNVLIVGGGPVVWHWLPARVRKLCSAGTLIVITNFLWWWN